MLQIVILGLAVLVFFGAIKAFTPSGFDLGFGGQNLTGTPAIIAGIMLLLISFAMVFFALFGMELLLS
mgnify:CR=1 FL=1